MRRMKSQQYDGYRKKPLIMLVVALLLQRFYLVERKREKEKPGKLLEFILKVSGRRVPGTDAMTSGSHCKSAILSVNGKS